LGLLLFAVVVAAVVESWEDVRPTLGRISLPVLALAWRVALRELGSAVRFAAAARIYLLGQLGKYAPGSVWALAVQMDLAARLGVPRMSAFAAGVIALGANLATGLALGIFLVPMAIGGSAWRTVATVGLVAASAVVLSPHVLAKLISLGLRAARGRGLEQRMTWRGSLSMTGFSFANWLCYGTCLWVLALSVGAPAARALPLCLAGMALAMSLGLLVVVAPSGIGVREAVIVAALAPVLTRPEALAIALAARLVFTVGDLLAALAVLRVGATHRRTVAQPPMPVSLREEDVEALNDRQALENPIDEYYANAPRPIRFVEARRLAAIREMVGDVRGLEIAEIGSGGGHVLRMFPEARLTAIDVSGVYLDIARKNLAGYDVRFLKGEVDKMDLPAASFDRIICTEVLEHVVDPLAVLAAMSRLLRPSGVAVVTVPNDRLIHRLKRLAALSPLGWFGRNRLEWGGDAYHIHQWSPREFESLLSAYLRVTDRRPVPFRALPIRACFRCVPKDGRAAEQR
jgi:SAM-dependent methyltransferase/uncharacterized membrane protein YbhN (UPF0104 family)